MMKIFYFNFSYKNKYMSVIISGDKNPDVKESIFKND